MKTTPLTSFILKGIFIENQEVINEFLWIEKEEEGGKSKTRFLRH